MLAKRHSDGLEELSPVQFFEGNNLFSAPFESSVKTKRMINCCLWTAVGVDGARKK